jgi:Putative oxalocrotonate tautomerase enzyme
MPLWRIFSHPSTFNLEQRKALAKSVTELYSSLPAFYVNVIVSLSTAAQIRSALRRNDRAGGRDKRGRVFK